MGMEYDSPLIGLFIIQIKFLWVPILINMLYGLGFQLGNDAFKQFLIIISLWIASGPVAAVAFNTFFVKEKIDIFVVVGLLLITVGSIVVVAHKEITRLFS